MVIFFAWERIIPISFRPNHFFFRFEIMFVFMFWSFFTSSSGCFHINFSRVFLRQPGHIYYRSSKFLWRSVLTKIFASRAIFWEIPKMRFWAFFFLKIKKSHFLSKSSKLVYIAPAVPLEIFEASQPTMIIVKKRVPNGGTFGWAKDRIPKEKKATAYSPSLPKSPCPPLFLKF